MDWDASMIVTEAHSQNTSCTHSGEVDLSASSAIAVRLRGAITNI